MKRYFLPITIVICLGVLFFKKQYKQPVPQNIAAISIKDNTESDNIKQSENIKKYSAILKKFFVQAEPIGTVQQWNLPFLLDNRLDIRQIKIIGKYGDYRSSRVAGHLHSGVDIVPADKRVPLDVYPAANGVVCFITQQAPVKTVIIKHKLKDGAFLYTAYIHLKDIVVKNRQNVDENTKIGTLYTKKEALAHGGNFDHLHFEVKKRIDDYSCASWLCMSRAELDGYFINPRDFLKTHLKQ